jgi:hypothetical protein
MLWRGTHLSSSEVISVGFLAGLAKHDRSSLEILSAGDGEAYNCR